MITEYDYGLAIQYHEAQAVTSPWGEVVLIDCGILADVRLLWSQGIQTSHSCEGPESRYVSVHTPADALRAAELLPWVKSAVIQKPDPDYPPLTGLYNHDPGWVNYGTRDISIEELRRRCEVSSQ